MKYFLCLGLVVLPFLMNAQSFICNGDFYLSLTRDDSTTLFYTVEIDSLSGTVDFNPFPADTTRIQINAIGYRVTDNLIYGIDQNGPNLVRINAGGSASILGPLFGLDPEFLYWAGAITPDGETMVIIGSGGTPLISQNMVFIDLTDQSYPTSSKLITYTDPAEGARLTDVSFDPLTGVLYGYDNHKNRLTTVDIVSGIVDNTTFPVSMVAQEMGAMYFDPFGNIYGYGIEFGESTARTLFQIDKETGSIIVLAKGPASQEKDGCSCPYTIQMTKRANPEITLSCTTIEYAFAIANSSGGQQTGINFEDVMPPNMTITEIVQNPFGGNVSGIGTSTLTISDMTVPIGVDSIVAKVFVDDTSIGIYLNQARLSNLPLALGEATVSDNPVTVQLFDSTALEVIPIALEFSASEIELCVGESQTLDAYIGGADYLWNTGSTEPTLEVTAAGTYWVDISSDCETVSDTIVVIAPSAAPSVELGADIYIDLGDIVQLSPNLFPNDLGFRWSMGDDEPFVMDCGNCENPLFQPTEDMTLTLYAQDAFGCNDTDEVNIFVNKVYNTYIPTAFSPNFDGYNDVFFPQGRPGTKVNVIRVYNRWGANVYEAKDIEVNDFMSGWDGTYKGERVNVGVYFFYAKIEYLDGKTDLIKGDLTLIR